MIERVREILAGRYELEREIGRGGMAVVFLARSTSGEPVALKVLPPERAYVDGMAARFIAECNAIERLTHPNIVSVLDRGHVDDLLWFAMEYIEGQPLSKLVQIGAVEPPRVARLLAQAAAALSYAHRHGVIHRDIKPSNMLVRRSTDELILMDFGIAKTMGDHTLTETGTAVGTAQYMSPEQLTGRDHVGPATDQYSLGVVAYELLSGARPFDVDSVSALAVAQSSRAVPPLAGRAPRCPVDLACLVERMLMQRPRWRWSDLDVVAEAAEEIAATGSAPSLKGIPGARAGGVRRSVVGLAAAMLLTVGAWFGYGYLTASPAQTLLSRPDSTGSGAGSERSQMVAPAPAPSPPPTPEVAAVMGTRIDTSRRADVPKPRVPVGRKEAAPGPSLVAQQDSSPAVVPLPTTGVLVVRSHQHGFVTINDGLPIRLTPGVDVRRTLPPGPVVLEASATGCPGRRVVDTVRAGIQTWRRIDPNCPET